MGRLGRPACREAIPVQLGIPSLCTSREWRCSPPSAATATSSNSSTPSTTASSNSGHQSAIHFVHQSAGGWFNSSFGSTCDKAAWSLEAERSSAERHVANRRSHHTPSHGCFGSCGAYRPFRSPACRRLSTHSGCCSSCRTSAAATASSDSESSGRSKQHTHCCRGFCGSSSKLVPARSSCRAGAAGGGGVAARGVEAAGGGPSDCASGAGGSCRASC
mmetsp:Transcript_73015/g.173940  ORF Transcript_73015/g.173940 Transcript_73015/m.173940 type:complete len:218 (-) Transcript_73015:1877-2530(-)